MAVRTRVTDKPWDVVVDVTISGTGGWNNNIDESLRLLNAQVWACADAGERCALAIKPAPVEERSAPPANWVVQLAAQACWDSPAIVALVIHAPDRSGQTLQWLTAMAARMPMLAQLFVLCTGVSFADVPPATFVHRCIQSAPRLTVFAAYGDGMQPRPADCQRILADAPRLRDLRIVPAVAAQDNRPDSRPSALAPRGEHTCMALALPAGAPAEARSDFARFVAPRATDAAASAVVYTLRPRELRGAFATAVAENADGLVVVVISAVSDSTSEVARALGNMQWTNASHTAVADDYLSPRGALGELLALVAAQAEAGDALAIVFAHGPEYRAVRGALGALIAHWQGMLRAFPELQGWIDAAERIRASPRALVAGGRSLERVGLFDVLVRAQMDQESMHTALVRRLAQYGVSLPPAALEDVRAHLRLPLPPCLGDAPAARLVAAQAARCLRAIERFVPGGNENPRAAEMEDDVVWHASGTLGLPMDQRLGVYARASAYDDTAADILQHAAGMPDSPSGPPPSGGALVTIQCADGPMSVYEREARSSAVLAALIDLNGAAGADISVRGQATQEAAIFALGTRPAAECNTADLAVQAVVAADFLDTPYLRALAIRMAELCVGSPAAVLAAAIDRGPVSYEDTDVTRASIAAGVRARV